MEDRYMKSLKELDLANLSESQQERLREVESKFNEEFGTKLYLMAMERE